MTRYYFGIDAGNSKTHGLIADEIGHVLAMQATGGGNWEGIGLDAAGREYQGLLDATLAEAGLDISQLGAAGYGLAGLDFPSDHERLRPVVEALHVPGPFFLENDTLIALRAGTTRPYGVVCIAGAGSTKAGRNRAGRVFRTWGLAANMGDWGGGGYICREALGVVGCAAKGIAPETALTAPILAHYGVSDTTALIEQITREGDYRIDFAPLVFEIARQGDPAAIEILLDAGHGLARGINAVIRGLDMEDEAFDLVLAGGTFKAKFPLLRDTLAADVRAVAPQVEIIRLTAPPVVGAALMAMDEDGLPAEESVRLRLIREVDERLGQ